MKGHAHHRNTHIYFCRNVITNPGLAAAMANLSLMEGVHVEPVPCGGRIDPRYILKAFEGDAHGVALITCPVTHCRMLEGNLRAIHRIGLVREFLAESGLDPDSVKVFVPDNSDDSAIRNSIADAGRFAAALTVPAKEVAQQ
ncbi:MAG TPA: hydrogenase iron-sulfur subunit [Geobacteraceae bacterium]|nr:hydrogenase iron-sulfur subunit [Geobacteraceae bacterium]